VNEADREFVAKHATEIAFAGGLGQEIHRVAGFENALRGIQLREKLGYAAQGFTEQTQSWVFRSAWQMMEAMKQEVPDYEAFYDTFSLIAAAGMVTERILLSSTTDCYRRPPSVIAQTLLTLDHITKGRVSVSVGTGENKQFIPHGLKRTLPRNERLEEYIRIVKALMRANDPVTIEGRFWPQKDALIALPSYREGIYPPVVLVGGGPAAMRIAGRVADGLGSYLPGGYANRVEAFEEDLAIFREEAERHGRDPKKLPVGAAFCCVLCEDDEQISRALESPYIKAFVLNLTPQGEHWKHWGGAHPLGDDWALSKTHRSTLFDRSEMQEILRKVSDRDVQQMIYVGTPEDVATRFAPWLRAAWIRRAPLGLANSFGTIVFPEQRELASDGLPRWHHLNLRFQTAMNEILAEG
jgi:phthiodiolone/phenolphthiodiolone dimycocerosates ketoreductase